MARCGGHGESATCESLARVSLGCEAIEDEGVLGSGERKGKGIPWKYNINLDAFLSPR